MNVKNILPVSLEKRAELFGREGTNCCRLVNMDGDGMPGVTIDRYDEFLLVQLFDEFGDDFIRDLIDSLEDAAARFSLPVKGILLKDRMKLEDVSDVSEKRRSTVVCGEAPPVHYIVRQNGILAYVDLLKGQNTGIFLDMREVREKIVPFYRDAVSMLNLFSYTGLFSVHALLNGAAHAVNVDLSRAVLKRAKQNYLINGLKVDERDFVYGDALEWIKLLGKKGKIFSFAVVDPPTFSRNRKRNFSIRRNFAGMLQSLSPLVPDGFVLSSVNSQSVSEKEYRSYHPARWELAMYSNESSDFPHAGDPYLKVGLWRTGAGGPA